MANQRPTSSLIQSIASWRKPSVPSRFLWMMSSQLAYKRHSATHGGGAPTPPPQPPPSLPPVVLTPMSVDEAPSLSEGPPLPGPSMNTPSLASVVAPPAPTKHRTQTRQLTTAVLACLVLVELWAGVASLSTSFMDAGHSLFAFCEANPLLHSLLSLLHPDSLTALKSEAGEWKDWVMPTTGVTWLIGGPSCTSLSTAGKQLAQNDPNSRYLRDHIAIAATCGALLILLENVPFLVEGDEEHGLYSRLLQQAAALGYTLSQTWFVRDNEVGGHTQRRRVFLVWEKTGVALQCGDWPQVQPPVSVSATILSALVDPDKVPAACWLQCQISLDMTVQVAKDVATRCGSVTRKGDLSDLRVGDLVSLKQSRGGRNKWRVMPFKHGSKIELRRADRKQPSFALVLPTDVTHTHSEKIPVYHPMGIGVGLRSWGEPPLKSGFAVAQHTTAGWRQM